jgi:ketosteroid isomerase-like protein
MADARDVVTRFYDAFQQRDGRTMASLYHLEANFEDPAFKLKGKAIGAMWRMLCERAQEFSLRYEILAADGERARVRWIANYLFSKTGRKVENHIEADITVRDGLIVEHRDRFNFWRWAAQALGPAGMFLGWSQVLKAKVRAEAAKGLNAYINANGLD